MSATLSSMLAETHMAEVSMQYRDDVASGGISGLWYLLIPVIAVAIAVAIYKIVDRPPPIVNTPRGLFHELCRNHRIGGAGRRLLEKVVEEVEVEHPATLFLSVQHFEAMTEKASLCVPYSPRETTLLATIKRRLFHV